VAGSKRRVWHRSCALIYVPRWYVQMCVLRPSVQRWCVWQRNCDLIYVQRWYVRVSARRLQVRSLCRALVALPQAMAAMFYRQVASAK